MRKAHNSPGINITPGHRRQGSLSMRYLSLLAICCMVRVCCHAQYYDYARISDLIILTDGGRIVEPAAGIKPYNTGVYEYTTIKLHVISIIDKEKPYTQKINQPFTIGKPAPYDSMEVLYHCCGISQPKDCVRNAKSNILTGQTQAMLLKSTVYKGKYLYLNSFNADTGQYELNAIMHLAQIAHISKMDQIKNDRERYESFVAYYIKQYTEGFKTDLLADLAPDGDFVQYYRAKGIIPDSSYSAVLTGTQKAALYKRLLEKEENYSFSLDGMKHRFNLLLPEYKNEKQQYFLNIISDTAQLKNSIANDDLTWEQVLEVMELVIKDSGAGDKLLLEQTIVTARDQLNDINEENEFAHNLNQLIARELLPLITDFVHRLNN